MRFGNLRKNPKGEYIWEGKLPNEIRVINKWFNEKFKKSTDDYINMKAAKEINRYSAIEYIKSALNYLEDEESRKLDYISKEFRSDIDNLNIKPLQ